MSYCLSLFKNARVKFLADCTWDQHALEALTTDSDNTEDHQDEQIHFQRGMGKNYERLELLGAAILKMGTSISLFAQNPDGNEFDYPVNRMCLICNKNIFTTAKKIKIYEYIRSQGFSRLVISGFARRENLC
jgi:endoribonuclease Dicer